MLNPTQLSEWRDLLGDVTPGPWLWLTTQDTGYVLGHPKWDCSHNGDEGVWEIAVLDDLIGEHPQEMKANAAHIARCDPATIASLIDGYLAMAEAGKVIGLLREIVQGGLDGAPGYQTDREIYHAMHVCVLRLLELDSTARLALPTETETVK